MIIITIIVLLFNVTHISAQTISCTQSQNPWSPLRFVEPENKLYRVKTSDKNTCFNLDGECLRLHFCYEEVQDFQCVSLKQYRDVFACQQVVRCQIRLCNIGLSFDGKQFAMHILKLNKVNSNGRNSTQNTREEILIDSAHSGTTKVGEHIVIAMFSHQLPLVERVTRWLSISALALLCMIAINGVVISFIMLFCTDAGRQLRRRVCPVSSEPLEASGIVSTAKVETDPEPMYLVLDTDEYPRRTASFEWFTAADETDSQLPTYDTAVRNTSSTHVEAM